MNSVSDVAAFAEKFDIDYNTFINMMVEDNIIPFYEQKILYIYEGVGYRNGWSVEVSKVFDAYIEETGYKELTD